MFNLAILETYLAEHIDGFCGPLDASAFSEGQSNPTYLLTTPERKYVLRKKPPGTLLKSAHAVDREYRVQRALWATDVPVARMLHLCSDANVIGTVFYVMEFAEGRIFWDPALPDQTRTERARVYDQMNQVLAAIHNIDFNAAGLSDFGRPSAFFLRQLGLWRDQYRASETEEIPAMTTLGGWLEKNLPEDDGQCTLVHGDYRIDNLLFDPKDLKIIAVFDWELSTLGDPLADLAYQVMQREMGRDWHLRGLAGLDTDALGIPSETSYIEAYCRRRRIDDLPHWTFAKAFAFFRFAAICQGVKKRALDGIAASPDAARVGAMARPLAELGARLIS